MYDLVYRKVSIVCSFDKRFRELGVIFNGMHRLNKYPCLLTLFTCIMYEKLEKG